MKDCGAWALRLSHRGRVGELQRSCRKQKTTPELCSPAEKSYFLGILAV